MIKQLESFPQINTGGIVMKKLKRFLAVLLALTLFCAGAHMFGIPVAAAPVDITTAFTDPNFRAAVYQVVGKTAPETICDTDAAGISLLRVNGKGRKRLSHKVFKIRRDLH